MSRDQFEQTKNQSLAHCLIKAGRLVHQHGIANARARFALPNLTVAHLELFPFIDFAGTSVTEIAQRKGVSKQAASKLVKQMVEMGILYFSEDESDKRTKLVRFHTTGPMSIQNGFKALEQVDKKIESALVDLNLKKMISQLVAVIGVLELK